jgi:1,4-dihydroxy-2-naphthoyl-CoA hydrolase
MPFSYQRTIHFADTDAAGVVFFANLLAICHEGYEEALAASGIELAGFFRESEVIVPIISSEASYLRPLAVGDKVRVLVDPSPLGEDSFEVRYEIVKDGPHGGKAAVRASTRHVCIDAKTRRRMALPPRLAAWAGVKTPA